MALQIQEYKPEMFVKKFHFANNYCYKHSKQRAFAARRQGKTRGAIGFSLNFLVTFSFKRKSDKLT